MGSIAAFHFSPEYLDLSRTIPPPPRSAANDEVSTPPQITASELRNHGHPEADRLTALACALFDTAHVLAWLSEAPVCHYSEGDIGAEATQECSFASDAVDHLEGQLHGFAFRVMEPLITCQDSNVGTLHIAFAKARSLGDLGLDRRRVQVLGDVAADLMQARLDLRRANRAVAEKELLAREADHRVANGLQLLQSALVLQAKLAEHAPTQLALQTAVRRVSAVARAHRQIHQAPAQCLQEGTADAAAYLETLLNDIGQQPSPVEDGSTACGRTVALQADPDVAAAVPALLLPRLGMIAAELVANALKHGAGPVVVTLHGVASTGSVTLSVEDEGPGFPSDFVPKARNSKGLGMQLVAALAGAGGVWIDPTNRRRIVVWLDDQARR